MVATNSTNGQFSLDPNINNNLNQYTTGFIQGLPLETKATFAENLKKLAEPFEEDDVYWLPQQVKGNKATAAAYANKRVYTDRLDEVLGAESWQIEVEKPVITEYVKQIKEKRADWKDPTSAIITPASEVKGYKVLVTARCGVYVPYMSQWVWKASSGVAEANDENSITTAEAQAVKRAISMWGPGNYFYQLGTQEVPYAQGKFTTKPALPDWAKPKRVCTDCGDKVSEFKYKTKDGVEATMSASDVLKRGRASYGVDVCATCQTARKNAK